MKLGCAEGDKLSKSIKGYTINSYRKATLWAGTLYISGTVAGILSVAFTTPSFEETDLLAKIADNENQLILGAFSWCIMYSRFLSHFQR